MSFAVHQGAEIAAAGTAAVVAVAGRTGPGMKIAGQRKILANQVRSHRLRVVGGELAVLRDQRTVGLDGEDGLADGPDRQRIEPAADAPRTRVTPIEAQMWPRIEPPRSSGGVGGGRVGHPLQLMGFACGCSVCRCYAISQLRQVQEMDDLVDQPDSGERADDPARRHKSAGCGGGWKRPTRAGT